MHACTCVQVGVQTKQQQNVVFEWVTQQLIASKKAGGPLAGVLFWEAGMGGKQVGHNTQQLLAEVGNPSC